MNKQGNETKVFNFYLNLIFNYNIYMLKNQSLVGLRTRCHVISFRSMSSLRSRLSTSISCDCFWVKVAIATFQCSDQSYCIFSKLKTIWYATKMFVRCLNQQLQQQLLTENHVQEFHFRRVFFSAKDYFKSPPGLIYYIITLIYFTCLDISISLHKCKLSISSSEKKKKKKNCQSRIPTTNSSI